MAGLRALEINDTKNLGRYSGWDVLLSADPGWTVCSNINVASLQVSRRIFLVDDHPIVALGLKIAVAGTGTLVFVGTAANPDAGLREVGRLRPNTVILDLVFDGCVTLALVRRARALLPHAAIIAFSSLPARLYARDALEAGANAFLSKDADMSDLIALIERLDAPPPARHGVPSEDDRLASLDTWSIVDGVHMTPRELQIAAHLSRGTSIDVIAMGLNISRRTVAVHQENIRKKLDCRDTKELVARLARLSSVDHQKS